MPRITYGEKYTITVTGAKWNPLLCSHCGCEYFYQVKHASTGTAENPLWLNKQGAVNKAEERANKKLEKRLGKMVKNYHCPACGYYQPDVVYEMKNMIWLKGILLGLITSAVVLLGTSLLMIFHWAFIILSIFCGLTSGLVASLIVLCKLRNFNPNVDAATRKNQKFSEKYPVLKKSDLEAFLVMSKLR